MLVPYLQGDNLPQTHDSGHVVHTLSSGEDFQYRLGKDS